MNKKISLKWILISHTAALLVAYVAFYVINKSSCHYSGCSFGLVLPALAFIGLWFISLFLCLLFYILKDEQQQAIQTENNEFAPINSSGQKPFKVLILIGLFLVGLAIFPYALIFFPFEFDIWSFALKFLAPILAIINALWAFRLRKEIGTKKAIGVFILSVILCWASIKAWNGDFLFD